MQHEETAEDVSRTGAPDGGLVVQHEERGRGATTRCPKSIVAGWLDHADDDPERALPYLLGLVRGQARIVMRDIDDGDEGKLALAARDLLRELLLRLEER